MANFVTHSSIIFCCRSSYCNSIDRNAAAQACSERSKSVLRWRSSGDTIPNCWGEFREIRKSKERRGIAAYGHPAGTPGATGVERLRPRENCQRLGGGEWGETD